MKQEDIDPLLEEVDEARRQIMAEHGDDYRKVLEFYVELGKKERSRTDQAQSVRSESSHV